jgi:hypothetical protein
MIIFQLKVGIHQLILVILIFCCYFLCFCTSFNTLKCVITTEIFSFGWRTRFALWLPWYQGNRRSLDCLYDLSFRQSLADLANELFESELSFKKLIATTTTTTTQSDSGTQTKN